MNDIEVLVDYCKRTLPLTELTTEREFYQSLPLCVIDTVFSINAHYQSTIRTVQQFCAYFQFPCLGPDQYPTIEHQLSVGRFLNLCQDYTIWFLARSVYNN